MLGYRVGYQHFTLHIKNFYFLKRYELSNFNRICVKWTMIRVVEKTTLLFESRLRKLLKYPISKVMNYPKIERSFLEILSIFRVLHTFLTTPTSMLNRWKILRERIKILSLNSSSSINHIKNSTYHVER